MAVYDVGKTDTCVQYASTMQSRLKDGRVRHCNFDIILSCYVRLNVLYDGISELGW